MSAHVISLLTYENIYLLIDYQIKWGSLSDTSTFYFIKADVDLVLRFATVKTKVSVFSMLFFFCTKCEFVRKLIIILRVRTLTTLAVLLIVTSIVVVALQLTIVVSIVMSVWTLIAMIAFIVIRPSVERLMVVVSIITTFILIITCWLVFSSIIYIGFIVSPFMSFDLLCLSN